MNKIKTLLAALLVLALSTACNKKSDAPGYHLQGTVEGISQPARLLLVDSDGALLDTIDVDAKGAFTLDGQADSVRFLSLYLENEQKTSYDFFTEQGNISMTIQPEKGICQLKGTEANEALQQMMTAMQPYTEKLNELEQLASDTTQRLDEWALIERYNQIGNELMKQLKEAAQKNTQNELGYMLVCRYIDPTEEPALLRQLIEQMPEQYRQRAQIKDLIKKLDAAKDTEEGQKMADFQLNDTEGQPVSIMSLVGQNRITILDFWASWCGPCRNEMPFMRQLYADYKGKGLGIVGISLDDSKDAWLKAITDLKIEWPQISDLQGWNNAAATLFQVNAIPFIVVVDANGTILKKGLRGEPLKEFISQQLQ